MKDLIAALRMAQFEIKGAHRDSKNPHFKSTYADYESVWNAVRDPLLKNKLCITHMMDGKTLITRLMHDNGGYLESKYPIIVKDETNPQHFKAAITYAKRANLEGLTGCPSTDDDDGNVAAGLNFKEIPKPSAIRSVTFSRGNPEHKFLLNKQIKFRGLDEIILTKHLQEFSSFLDKHPPANISIESMNEYIDQFMKSIGV